MKTFGKAFVLLSGGIDSTTCLYLAKRDADQVEAVSINYGQRHLKEVAHARRLCESTGVGHHILDLSAIIPKTMLTDHTVEVPDISYSEIEGVSPTYVPFRNGLMLSALTSYAAGRYESEKAEGEWAIYFGAHSEDAANWAYPDCTAEWTGAMANAIYIGTYHHIRLITPLQWMTKAGVVMIGNRLGVDWAKTWSCYKGGNKHCGTCPTCRSRREAFIEAGVLDPTVYEN